MLKTQQKVHDMMVLLGIPLPNENGTSYEGMKNLNYGLLRRLVDEEFREYSDAMCNLWMCFDIFRDDASKDHVYKCMAEVIDAICDMIIVIHNTTNAMGIDIEPFFDEVHESNMRKVGGPIRDDGKRLKPAGWQPPKILEMLKQMNILENE